MLMPRRIKAWPNSETFMRTKEAAYTVGMSRDWLYDRLRGRDPPPHKRVGGRWLLPRTEFTEWAKKNVIR